MLGCIKLHAGASPKIQQCDRLKDGFWWNVGPFGLGWSFFCLFFFCLWTALSIRHLSGCLMEALLLRETNSVKLAYSVNLGMNQNKWFLVCAQKYFWTTKAWQSLKMCAVCFNFYICIYLLWLGDPLVAFLKTESILSSHYLCCSSWIVLTSALMDEWMSFLGKVNLRQKVNGEGFFFIIIIIILSF